MLRLFIILLLGSLSQSGFSRIEIDPKIDSVDSIKKMYYTNDTIFDPIETQPIFPGGMDSLYCFIESRLNFKILNYTKHEGRVIAQFVIERSGKVTNVEVNPKYIHRLSNLIQDSLIENEIRRVLQLLPDWTPGFQRDKPVRVRFTIPFRVPYTDFKCKTMDNPTAAYWEVDEYPQFRYKEEINTINSIHTYIAEKSIFESQGDRYGRVYVRLVINEQGALTDYFIVRGLDGCKGYNEEALRVVGLMPKWSPAVKDGKAVRSTVVIPIRFELR